MENMNFLKNAQQGNNHFRSYLFTLALVIFSFLFLGLIPMLLHAFIKTMINGSQSSDFVEMEDLFGSNLELFYLLVPFAFALGALLIGIRFIHGRSVLSVFTSRSRFDWSRFFVAAGIWMLVMCILLIVSILIGQPIEWNLDPSTFIPLLLISLLIIPIQTTAEEVLFRGYFMQGFGQLYKKGFISILLTGVLFGLMHGGNPEVAELGYGVMAYYIITGIFLGILAVLDDGLELSMGYHAANNIFASLILTNDWQAFQTDAMFIDHTPPNFGWDSLITLLILQPALILLFSRIYKWKNWKERLF